MNEFHEFERIRIPEEEISQSAKDLARYINDNKFDAVVFSGGSREISKRLFEKGWSSLFQESQKPSIIEIDSIGNSLLYKEKDERIPFQSIEDWIDKHIPELRDFKDKRICFVDEFINTGEKTKGILDTMRRQGFNDVNFAAFTSSDKKDPKEFGDKVYIAYPENPSAYMYLENLSKHIQGGASSSDIFKHTDKEKPEYYKDLAQKQMRAIIEKLG